MFLPALQWLQWKWKVNVRYLIIPLSLPNRDLWMQNLQSVAEE